MSTRRLVRRKPFVERMKDKLHPGDWLLYLSEEFETRDWDSRHFATPLAFGLHFIFLIARANVGGSSRGNDEVFGDDYSATGWLSYIATIFVWILTGLSISNAAYTFSRKRHYRLFESDIDTAQSTPSARRVRVDSSPMSSSPLRFFTSILGDTDAQSRAHPDPTRDVWELALWDPLPICLRMFCFFSPGHVLVYWLFLPTVASDPRPSVTVFTTVVLEILLSSQLYLLQSSFSQQEKDSAIIQKEVMNEYDTKYVHPRMNPIVRDVGTQYRNTSTDTTFDGEGLVELHTPTTVLKRGFKTNPNPNYAKHLDPEGKSVSRRDAFSPTAYTPSAYTTGQAVFPSQTPQPRIRQPQFRQSTPGTVSSSSNTSQGDGGSLGVYSHANSPLKKATSMYDIQRETPRTNLDMAARERAEERERAKSPEKQKSRMSDAHRAFLGIEDKRRESAPPSAFGLGQGRPSSLDRRGPSRF